MVRTVESRKERRRLAADAGLGAVSLVSVIAGMLVALGAFSLISAVTGASLELAGVDTRGLSEGDWRDVGIGMAVVIGIVATVSWLFGSYVAGRMARRAGMLNGLSTFVLSVLVGGGLGVLLAFATPERQLDQATSRLGIPTSWEDWQAIATIAGVVILAAVLAASLLGGWLGERWHGKLVTRAAHAEPTSTEREPIDLRERKEERAEASGDEGAGELHTHADGNMHSHPLDEHAQR